MKCAEWEKLHDYGSKRVCRYCKHIVVKDCMSWLVCEEKEKAGAGRVVKPRHSCDLWEGKK